MRAFYQRDGDTFVATADTRGPWDERFQHGGPPSARLARALIDAVEAQAEGPFVLARLTTEFLRPVPIGALTIKVLPLEAGRTVARAAAVLESDRPLMRATAVFIRAAPDLSPATAHRPDASLRNDAEWPTPDDVAPFVFTFFTAEEGYHRAVALKLIDAPWGSTPVRFWAQPVCELVEGEPTRPEERVIILADAESGMGAPVDPLQYSYVNPDLTVYFARRPRPGWIGLDIRSAVGDAGAGLSESSLRDANGVFGRSAQSLVLAAR